MWLIINLLLLAVQPVFAQDIASPSSTQSATTAPTESPSPIPTATAIPTPTPNPNIALFDEYSQTYFSKMFAYSNAYLDFTNKRNVHTKYGTITSLKDQVDATKTALTARNTLLRTYLTALRVKLKILEDQDPTDTSKIEIEINKWEDWLNEQDSVVESLNNLDDIAGYAQGFKRNYINIEKAIYTGLIQDEINLRNHTLKLVMLLRDDIQSSSSLQPQSQEWLSSITIKTDLVTNNLKQAYDVTQNDQNNSSSDSFSNFYPMAKDKINKANSYILEMRNNLQSIVIKFLNK
jgi:hypothetical protein